MRNKLLQEILDETPKEVEIFVEKYADLVIRINSILKDKGLTQKSFAEKMDQKPSAVSRWLSGNHNITLRSIAKMEAELGETIIEISNSSNQNAKEYTMAHSIIVNKKALINSIPESKNKSKVKVVKTPLDNSNGYQSKLFANTNNYQDQIA